MTRVHCAFLVVSAALLSLVGPVVADNGEMIGTMNTYGRTFIHLACVDDDARVENSASWVGRQFSIGDALKAFGQIEWGINLTKGDQLNLGTSTGGDFGKVDETQVDPSGLRLGFLGVDFVELGRISIGKQNAPHYDIASFTTDRWNVFGGEGSIA